MDSNHKTLDFNDELFSVESMDVEANEPSLENRRIKVGMQYATTLKAYPSNPAHDCVFNPLYENVYDKQLNTIQPFGL